MWLGFLVSSSGLVQSLHYSYAGYMVVTSGGLLICLGFLGALGAWKGKNLYLMVFLSLGLATGILLISFGSVVLYIRQIAGQVFMDQDTCKANFGDADQLAILAGEVMCGMYCPCSVNSGYGGFPVKEVAQGSALNALDCNPCENIQTYEVGTQGRIVAWIKTTLGYNVTADACAVTASEFNTAYYPRKNIVFSSFITWMEETLQCSGVCTAQKILLFSDINNNYTPSTPCYHEMKYWAHENLQNYGIIALVFGFYQFVACAFVISFACCGKKRRVVQEPDGKANATEVFRHETKIEL